MAAYQIRKDSSAAAPLLTCKYTCTTGVSLYDFWDTPIEHEHYYPAFNGSETCEHDILHDGSGIIISVSKQYLLLFGTQAPLIRRLLVFVSAYHVPLRLILTDPSSTLPQHVLRLLFCVIDLLEGHCFHAG